MPQSTEEMAQLNSTSPAPKLLNVSMHLGVHVFEREDGTWGATEREGSGNVIAESLQGMKDAYNVDYLQIGWVGCPVPTAHQDALTSELMLNKSCFPLFMTDQEREDFYYRFCKGVLWPTMNYSLANSRRFHGIEQLWKTYNKVMHYAADAVTTHYRAGDVIWVHDYHHLCLPAFIRKRLPQAKIGFFLHCTFPSSELFRQIPIRESVLQGLCAADVIGFQTYNYCRYFMRSVSILLDWHCGPASVTDPNGRVTRVHVNPTGLSVRVNELKLADEGVRATAARWREATYKDSKVIVGRCNRLDKYQGIVEKLQAFDHFLTVCPEWIERVVLVQSILDDGQGKSPVHDQEDLSAQMEEVHEERSLLVQRVQELVGRINGIHGTVVMITPTRDGMNLIAHESVLATKESHAPLILSEFAGAASCLGGSLIINPYDKAGMADALGRALAMGAAEKARNHAHNLRYVERNTSSEWARSCIAEIVRDQAASSRSLLKGLALDTFLVDFTHAEKRLLLVEYEGTLVPEAAADTAAPSAEVLKHLNTLAAAENVCLYVMSGRSRAELEAALGSPEGWSNLGLCASHGMASRHPGEGEEWTRDLAAADVDLSWKEPVRALLENFCDRTPGTDVAEAAMSLTWRYCKADQHFARWLVKDLVQVLHQLADQYSIAVQVTPRTVEVRPLALTRAAVVRQILSRHPNTSVLYHFGCASQDKDLPELFQVSSPLGPLSSSGGCASPLASTSSHSSLGTLPRFVTCTIGASLSTSTYAYFLQDTSDVPSLLKLLCGVVAS